MTRRPGSNTTAADWHAEHVDFHRLLAEVREVLQRRQGHPKLVVLMLCELCDFMRAHFLEEEEGGYFAEALQAAPQLASEAERLLREHAGMTRELEMLCVTSGELVETPTGRERLMVRFTAFADRFCQHEAAETRLLQVAFADELGEAD